jgi:uncharacterized repeat protein (TIGR01451 family)
MALLVATEQLAISGTAVEITGVDWPSDGPQLPLKQTGTTGPPQLADLAISKVGSPEPATVGEPLTYTLTVVNQGFAEATGVMLVDLLPVNVEFGSPAASQGSCSRTSFIVSCDLNSLPSLDTATVTIVVTPTQTGVIFNTAAVASTGPDDPDLNNNTAIEQTAVNPAAPVKIFLPIILRNYPIPPAPPPPPPPPAEPLAYVSDVAIDPDTNQIFVASPRHDWVYVIDGNNNDTIARSVPVGNGPTGLTVLDGAMPANNKVFVAHQYGANFWRPGAKVFGVNESASRDTSDGGYVGAAPIKIAANPANNRVYVSNYFDRLAVLIGSSESRFGWVAQKAYQGAYGIDVSASTRRVYLATRDTGELIVFDGNSDRLLQANYIPTHVKPPAACSLWSVAVNEVTGHVFVPCPQLGKVFVLQESQVSLLSLEALGVLEERDGYWALVVAPEAAPWVAEIDVPSGLDLGQEGIAVVDSSTGYVFITNASNNTLAVLQDDPTAANISYRSTVAVGANPQGVAVNPLTQKVYVGNSGDNTVTVLSAVSPFNVMKTIPLTP